MFVERLEQLSVGFFLNNDVTLFITIISWNEEMKLLFQELHPADALWWSDMEDDYGQSFFRFLRRLNLDSNSKCYFWKVRIPLSKYQL